LKLPKEISIVEVVLRDGLQSESTILSVEEKLSILESILDSGINNIELTSFVHPKKVPQLADAEILLEKVPWSKNIIYSGVIPNIKGFERSQNTKLEEITVIISASESHNKNNINSSISESLNELEIVCKIAKNKEIKVRGEISVAFGCPFEGKIPFKKLKYIINKLNNFGCSEIVLADTTGQSNPLQVFNIFKSASRAFPQIIFSAHFHDANNLAMANVFAALQAGVNKFDTSLGGLGGCPFIPNASGNISTEKLVYMMKEMQIITNIDIKKLLTSIRLLEKLIKKNIHISPFLINS
jgi:hydroxymethylglutaryl-CoA lyase